VAKQIATKIGDVLILATSRSYTIYAVGSVSEAGQHDFSRQQKVTHVASRTDALKAAKALVAPGGRIYLLNIDTADWSEISN
jgi:hypothetical protein